VRGLR